jgi:hypothetical protein
MAPFCPNGYRSAIFIERTTCRGLRQISAGIRLLLPLVAAIGAIAAIAYVFADSR